MRKLRISRIAYTSALSRVRGVRDNFDETVCGFLVEVFPIFLFAQGENHALCRADTSVRSTPTPRESPNSDPQLSQLVQVS